MPVSASSASRARADAVVATPADVEAFGVPGCVLKTTRGGYDGKGVWFVASAAQSDDQCAEAFEAAAAAGVRAARRGAGRRSVASCRRSSRDRPAARRRRTRSSRRCSATASAARSSLPHPASTRRWRARRSGSRSLIAGELDVTGVLAVELFETDRRRMLVNELAMRPHNSGHWTIDGAVTEPVRAAPARRARPAARLTGAAVAVDGDGQRARRANEPGPLRRLPARDGARPRAAGAPLRQGACGRDARSATSTPSATTWRTAWSGRGTRPPGIAGESGDESE